MAGRLGGYARIQKSNGTGLAWPPRTSPGDSFAGGRTASFCSCSVVSADSREKSGRRAKMGAAAAGCSASEPPPLCDRPPGRDIDLAAPIRAVRPAQNNSAGVRNVRQAWRNSSGGRSPGCCRAAVAPGRPGADAATVRPGRRSSRRRPYHQRWHVVSVLWRPEGLHPYCPRVISPPEHRASGVMGAVPLVAHLARCHGVPTAAQRRPRRGTHG